MFTFHAYELLFLMLRGAVIVGGVTAGLDVCQAGDHCLRQLLDIFEPKRDLFLNQSHA